MSNDRYKLDKYLERAGKFSIGICFIFLVFFIGSLVLQAVPAFSFYVFEVDVNAKKPIYSEQEAKSLLQNYFQTDKYSRFLNKNATKELLDNLKDDGHKSKLSLLVSNQLNDFLKDGESKFFDESEQSLIKKLQADGMFNTIINWNLFVNTESRDPSQAGILTAIIGSMFTIFICIAISLPIAVLAAIYLDEFAPKNAITSIIELNINNLAAVPSIVFGLLGLSFLINFCDFPRSSSIVAGITLAMMVLPIMIISTRGALSRVPNSIKQAALALGATKIQIIIHHTLPLALPGIMTGLILSIARAIGETAPLILIGMVAFIIDVPSSVFDPATVLPVQIFLWTQNPEHAFHAKTAAAILILLVIMIILNLAAILVRKKFEKRW